MGNSRDTVTYSLYDGRKMVYIGTTNDPERRLREHEAEGKYFTRMDVTSRKITSEGAARKEAQKLAVFRKGHGGRNPRYNMDKRG